MKKRSREYKSLEEQTLAHLKKNGTTKVSDLYDVLRKRNLLLTEAQATDLVWWLVQHDKASVEDVPPTTSSLHEYLQLWETNLWFYVSLAVTFATVVAVYILPSIFPLVAARWVLGTLFVVFLPGFMTVQALFPRGRDLDWVERFALSVGLSLALAPLIGLLLNYTPWGIRVTPVVISLAILTVGLAVVALARRYRMSVETFEI